MSDIWQTTNSQPWVEALACGLISVKTRTSKPVVPVGATVLLHTSKSKLWKHWAGLSWIDQVGIRNLLRGFVVAVATIEAVGPTKEIFKNSEYKFWDVYEHDGKWNSAAEWAVRFKDIQRLPNIIAVQGFQAPFAHAKTETIRKIISNNPKFETRLSGKKRSWTNIFAEDLM